MPNLDGLQSLEHDGLIKRTVFNNIPPMKVLYKLTEFGKTLIPILKAIADWRKFAANQWDKIQVVPCDV